MPYLTALIKDKTALTYRYYVELVSVELDFEGVPRHTQIVDVRCRASASIIQQVQ